jgi:hypothetical protein
MKNLILILALIMLLVVPVLADTPHDPTAIATITNSGNSTVGSTTNTFTPTNSFSSTNSFHPVSLNVNTDIFAPRNSNSQGQLQGQIANNNQEIAPVQITEIENPREFLSATPQMVTPQINPLIQGGIGDAKSILPNFAGLKWLGDEEVVKVVIYNSSPGLWPAFLDRICMEDLEADILSYLPKVLNKFGVEDASRVGFRVYFKAKSKGIGGGSQGNGAGSYLPGGGGSSASALSGGFAGILGYNSSWVDPTYTIKYYLKK